MPDSRKLNPTPEPWVNVGKVGFAIGIYAQDVQVAMVYGPTTNRQAEDNALLIEAAPKMYRALLAQDEADKHFDEGCGFCDPGCPCDEYAELKRVADNLTREVLEELHRG